jgi:CBS domain-containing protein
MHAQDVAAVPVIDANLRLVGMLSVDDLVRWEASRGSSRGWIRTLESTVLVAHVMTHEVIPVSPDDSITAAARVMRYVARSALPVTDSNGWLVGIVSARDVASASARTDVSLELEVREGLTTRVNTTQYEPVNIHVEGGTVTLTGVVTSRRRQHALRTRVAAIPGVTGVRTELMVAQPERTAREHYG